MSEAAVSQEEPGALSRQNTSASSGVAPGVSSLLTEGKSEEDAQRDLDQEEADETEKNLRKNQNQKKKFTEGILEMLSYVVFLTLFLFVVGTNKVGQAYPYSAKLKELILGDPGNEGDFGDEGYMEIFDHEGVYTYMKGTFAHSVWQDTYFSDKEDPDQLGYILGVDKIIGAVRIQQTRVAPDDQICAVPPVYQDIIDNCYPSLDRALLVGKTADNKDYGITNADGLAPEDRLDPNGDGDTSDSEWPLGKNPFSAEDMTPNSPLRQYRYTLTIPSSTSANNVRMTEAMHFMDMLQEHMWIDAATREIHLELTVYNPSIDLFCAIDLRLMFKEEGGVWPRYHFRTINLMRHMMILTRARTFFAAGIDPADWALLFVEIIFYTYVAVQAIVNLRLLCKMGGAYFNSIWATLDLLNLSLFVAMIILRIFTIALVSTLKFDPEADQYQDFSSVAEMIYLVQNLTSFNIVLSWFKLFKYLRLSPRLGQLTETLGTAANDLIGFTFMFAIVFVAYAMAFNLAFGMDLYSFRTIENSMFTLIRMILGEFDFEELRRANETLGPLLFITYVVIVFFVLINMFLAIIGDAHTQVKNKAAGGEDEFLVAIRTGLLSFINKLPCIKKKDGVDGALQQIKTTEGVKGALLQQRFQEITAQYLEGIDPEEIFAKFDTNEDGELTGNEINMLLNALENHKIRLMAEAQDGGNTMEHRHKKLEEAMHIDARLQMRRRREMYGKEVGLGPLGESTQEVKLRLERLNQHQEQMVANINNNQETVTKKLKAVTDVLTQISEKIPDMILHK